MVPKFWSWLLPRNVEISCLYQYEHEISSDDRWQVTWTSLLEDAKGVGSETKGAQIDVFDRLIVASGFFSRPNTMQDDSVNVHKFRANPSNTCIHSSDYRDPSSVNGTHVLVLGNGFSGIDIAAELAESGKQVTVVFRNPTYILPRYLRGRPIDMLLYSRASRAKSRQLSLDKQYEKSHSVLSALSLQVGKDMEYSEEEKRKRPPFVCISDSFQKVASKITLIRSRVAAFDEKGPPLRLLVNFYYPQ